MVAENVRIVYVSREKDCRNCLPSSSGCCSNMKQISITTDLDNIIDNTCPPPDANQRVMTALPKSHSESRNEGNMSNAEVNISFEQLNNPNNAIILPPPPPPPPPPIIYLGYHLLGVIMTLYHLCMFWKMLHRDCTLEKKCFLCSLWQCW